MEWKLEQMSEKVYPIVLVGDLFGPKVECGEGQTDGVFVDSQLLFVVLL